MFELQRVDTVGKIVTCNYPNNNYPSNAHSYFRTQNYELLILSMSQKVKTHLNINFVDHLAKHKSILLYQSTRTKPPRQQFVIPDNLLRRDDLL